MPALLTESRFDEATQETFEKAASLLKHSKLIIYENSARFAFLNEEGKYLQDLKIFLESADK
jgi:hypothetical protein